MNLSIRPKMSDAMSGSACDIHVRVGRELVAGKGIGSHVPAINAAMAVISVVVTVDPVLWGIGG